MKILACVAIGLFLSVAAQADLKPQGFPIATECGNTQSTGGFSSPGVVRAREICLGRISGYSKRNVLLVNLSDGTSRIFEIVRVEPVATNHVDENAVFDLTLVLYGSFLEGRFVRSTATRGILAHARRVASPEGLTLSVSGAIPGNVLFKASEFEPVYTTAE